MGDPEGDLRIRSDAELRKLAEDIVEGRVYGDWMVPLVPPGDRGPGVAFINRSQPLITPLELQAQADSSRHPGWEPDIQTISSMFPVIMLAEDELRAQWEECGVAHFFEYASEANPSTQVNGLPMFWSAKIILRAELHTLDLFIFEYRKLKEGYMEGYEVDTPSVELPATVTLRYVDEVPGGRTVTIYEFPVRCWADDGITLQTGYREGVKQNKNISVGATFCCIQAKIQDD